MKAVSLAIFLGCLVIGIAIYLGLTYEKRSYMEFCLGVYDRDTCEMTFQSKR
jgi:hypothetical protein